MTRKNTNAIISLIVLIVDIFILSVLYVVDIDYKIATQIIIKIIAPSIGIVLLIHIIELIYELQEYKKKVK